MGCAGERRHARERAEQVVPPLPSAPKPLLRAVRVVVAVALVLGFLRDLLPHPSYQPPWGDMLYFHFLWEAARTTWLEYRQVPLWNPFHCGGMVELANPHSMALSPFTLVAVLFDAGTGLRLFILAHLVIGFLGAWAWARERGLGDPWAMAPAIAFTMGGYFTERAMGIFPSWRSRGCRGSCSASTEPRRARLRVPCRRRHRAVCLRWLALRHRVHDPVRRGRDGRGSDRAPPRDVTGHTVRTPLRIAVIAAIAFTAVAA